MTYAQNSLVEAADYNNLRTTYNNLWGVGSGSYGLGQATTLNSVAVDSSVTYSEWQALGNGISNLGSHQQSVLTKLPAFNRGDLIAYTSALGSNLTTLNNNRGWARAQGNTLTPVTTQTTSTWNNALTFTQTVTFQSVDRARYFFNAGGQIIIQPVFSSSSGTVGATFFSRLAALCGSWIISGVGGTIAGTTYTPFTKSGGTASVSPSNINTSLGYYGLTTSYQQAIKILSDGTIPSSSIGGSYGTGSYIQLNVKTDGATGSNSGNGSVLSFQTIWDEVPNGLDVIGTTSVQCIIKLPSTSFITSTWGTISVSGTVTGS